MFFILLRVLFCTPLILTAIGSPIFLVENPAAPATVTVSASVWSPTATLSTLPFSPLLGGVNYPAVSFGNALSSLFRAASGSSTAQGAVPSVLAPAASALDAAAAAPTLFAAAELSSNTVSDAGFVTAVGAANVTAKALIKASNTLVNTLLLIIHGLAANNIPANVISNFVVTSGDYDAKITALTKAITGGVAEVDTAYLTTSIASIANDIDGETAQIQQLQAGGAAFNAQFMTTLAALQQTLTVFATSLSGNDAIVCGTAASRFSAVVAALKT